MQKRISVPTLIHWEKVGVGECGEKWLNFIYLYAILTHLLMSVTYEKSRE